MKKFLIIVCVVAAIIFLCWAGKYMDDPENGNTVATNGTVITGKNNTKNNATNSAKNKVNNTTVNNTANNTSQNTTNVASNNTNTTQNTTNNSEKENPANNTTNTTNTEQNKVGEQTSLSDEDKAKKMAEQEYGSSDGVYFRIEQVKSNGVYIISVRDSETTRDLTWYTVDVNAGTVR